MSEHDPAKCVRNLAGQPCRACGEHWSGRNRLAGEELRELARTLWMMRPEIEAEIEPPAGRLTCDVRYTPELVYGAPEQCEHGVNRAVPTRCALCRVRGRRAL